MIKTIDIFEEIDRTLRALFPKINKVHLERLNKMKGPALSLEIISYKAPVFDQYVSNKKVDIEIIYFSKNNSVAEALTVQEELTRAFSLGLKVKDRFIHMGDEIDARLVDQVLHFVMQFDYYDELAPLIATENENLARPDTGSTDIDIIIEENEVIPDPTIPPIIVPVDPKDPSSEELIDDSNKELIDDLKYMETLKVNYTLT